VYLLAKEILIKFFFGRFQRKAEIVVEEYASCPKLNSPLGSENYEFPEANKL
jgi:hypothetical protein